MTAEFTVENVGAEAAAIEYFLLGLRSPSGQNVDLPASPKVLLEPGGRHTYRGTRTLVEPGEYRGWPAFFDRQNWIALADPQTVVSVR